MFALVILLLVRRLLAALTPAQPQFAFASPLLTYRTPLAVLGDRIEDALERAKAREAAKADADTIDDEELDATFSEPLAGIEDADDLSDDDLFELFLGQ